MKLLRGELRSHLDPMALRILKKRLVSGKITPQVFKDILKQQMVKYYFRTYRHPLLKSWGNWKQPDTGRLKENGRTTPRPGKEKLAMYNHKRF